MRRRRIGGAAAAAAAGLRLEACLGTTPAARRACARSSQAAARAAAAAAEVSAPSHLFSGLELRCDLTYYATARATNCAGLRATAVSEGATLCCVPPALAAGGRAWGAVGADGEAATVSGGATTGANGAVLAAAWQFEDGCSGVREQTVGC